MTKQIQEIDKKINAIYEKYADEYDVLAKKSEELLDKQEVLDKERKELKKSYEKLEEKANMNALMEFGGLLKQRQDLKKADTHPEHRAKAVMYNWLSFVEKTDGNAEPFLQIMAENFSVDFGTGKTYNTREELAGWVKNTATSVIWSHHYPQDMETEVLENDDIQFQVTFDWQGESKDGKLMKVKTRHTWILENDLQKENAKIKDIKVKYIEPFSVVGEVE